MHIGIEASDVRIVLSTGKEADKFLNVLKEDKQRFKGVVDNRY